jgi:S-DNA-T family DNA segregation ATPase FtsK/SpoIIIE
MSREDENPTPRVVRAVLILGLATVAGVSLASFSPVDWPLGVGGPLGGGVRNLGGPLGALFAAVVRGLLGPVLSWFPVAALAAWAWFVLVGSDARRVLRFYTLGGITLLFACTLLSLGLFRGADDVGAGGRLGETLYAILTGVLGEVGGSILLFAGLAALVLRVFFPRVRPVLAAIGARTSGVAPSERMHAWIGRLGAFARRVRPVRARPLVVGEETVGASPRPARTRALEPAAAGEEPIAEGSPPELFSRPAALIEEEEQGSEPPGEETALPSLELLSRPEPAVDAHDQGELLRQSGVLESKLADYGIRGRVSHVRPGPVVTTFEFEPAPGVKISQITSRADDLALALMAQGLRMVAPIPGKAAVGVEIPNAEPQMVTLRQIIGDRVPDAPGRLPLFLGKTVTGEPFTADLAEMPHLLIAGSTGSGKSVCIHSLIVGLLLQKRPSELRLLLVDPKMLELSVYQGVPHLLHPVITVPRDAQKAFTWLVSEMESRYRLLAHHGVRNITGYNRKVRSGVVRDEEGRPVSEQLPFYVTVVDELADLMITLGNDIEGPLTRLAQMARAVGIHLVLATQRPSVDVITGVIKANFPSRIAFRVASRTDSRTILDGNGAERLLGRGDMLYLPSGRPSPIRLHGSFVSTEECELIAETWRRQARGVEEEVVSFQAERETGEHDPASQDEYFDRARELVILHQQGSISLIQRRLKVGYSRAARLMDLLEMAGVVGPFEGSKAREVLVPPEAYERES